MAKYHERLQSAFRSGTIAEIEACLYPDEKVSDFIRKAVETELASRESQPQRLSFLERHSK